MVFPNVIGISVTVEILNDFLLLFYSDLRSRRNCCWE